MLRPARRPHPMPRRSMTPGPRHIGTGRIEPGHIEPGPRRAPLARWLPAVVLALSCACASTKSSVATETTGSGWLEPSPQLREQIDEAAQRLPWTHGLERVELIHWFAQVGEPAYPTLLAMACDVRRDVAGAALAALGATRDSRLVEPLRATTKQRPQDADLALERARTLLRLGDWEAVPALIEGLSDERLMTRALSIQALFEATHERFGYDARATLEERSPAVERWRQWWAERSHDILLQTAPPGTPATPEKPAGASGAGGATETNSGGGAADAAGRL